MADQKKMAMIIVNHLKSQLKSGGLSDDAIESVEISVQCIESAYNLNPTDSDKVDVPFADIVKRHFKSLAKKANFNIYTTKDEAEYHKTLGNDYLKNQINEKAIESYTRSIALNSSNPIYFCNRAAAYNAVGKYKEAILDCRKAIALDASYCKAYCRLGLAFSCLNDFGRAVVCYKKACELEPSNINYRRNYQLTLQNLLTQIVNPRSEINSASRNLMHTASSLIANPDVTSVFNNVLGNMSNSNSNMSGLDRLMQVGQTIVTRLQLTNPNFIEDMRLQFQNIQNEANQPRPAENGTHTPNNDNHS